MSNLPSFDLDSSFKTVSTSHLPTRFKEDFGIAIDKIPDQALINAINRSNKETSITSLLDWDFALVTKRQNGYLRVEVDLSENTKNSSPINRYQLLVEAANDIIFEIDVKGIFSYMNPTALRLSGYPEDEIVGHHFTKLIREDWKEKSIRFYQEQVVNSVKSTYFEFPVCNANQEEIWIGQKVQLLENESGIVGLMAVGRDITDKKQTEEALKQSEEKYRGIIQNLNVGLMEVDLEENILYANSVMSDILGYSQEELLSMKAISLITDEESLKTLNEEHSKRDEGDGSVYQVQLTHKEGHPLWALISGAPIYDQAARRVGSIGMHLDITDQKNAQKELEFTKSRLNKYRQGLELINEITSNTELSTEEQLSEGLATAAAYLELPIGIISSIRGDQYTVEEFFMKEDTGILQRGLTFDFKKTYCEIVFDQETYIAINHFSQSEYLGHPCYELFRLETYIGAPYYVNGVKRGTVNFYDAGPRSPHFDSYDTEFISLLSKWIGSLVSQLETQDALDREKLALSSRNEELFRQREFLDAINGFVTSLLDKDELEDISWEIVEKVIESFGFEDCVIYLLDEEAGILRQIAAYGPKKAKSRTIVDPIDIPLGQGIVGFVAKSGKSEIISDTSKDKRYIQDDEARLSELCVPIISDNEVIGAIDSEHNELNFFTEEHRDTLQTVANLAATRLKLARAKAKEKELNDLKSRFISMASHEFRTPLTTIRQNVDLVAFKLEKDQPETASQYSKFLKRVDSEIERLTLLMNDILTLGRIESGRVRLRKEPVDLVWLCKNILSNHGTSKEDNREISFQVLGEPKEVGLDEHLFGHVLTNLISNAFKYSKGKKNPEIDLSFKDDDCIELSVKDYGIGIPKKDQEGLFQSFYRATNVMNIQGSGLGLSIVKEFVEMHGGSVSVESDTNKGCEFKVYIPYK